MADITETPAETQDSSQTQPVASSVEFPEDGAIFGDERVVHDKDESGNTIGWHKEPVKETK